MCLHVPPSHPSLSLSPLSSSGTVPFVLAGGALSTAFAVATSTLLRRDHGAACLLTLALSLACTATWVVCLALLPLTGAGHALRAVGIAYAAGAALFVAGGAWLRLAVWRAGARRRHEEYIAHQLDVERSRRASFEAKAGKASNVISGLFRCVLCPLSLRVEHPW